MNQSIRTSVTRVTVDADSVGQRVDNFLRKHLNDIPQRHIYRIIRTGQVRVNGKRIKPAYRLAERDELRLPPLRHDTTGEPRAPDDLCQRLEASVIHEDAALLVINKPPGLAVHRGSEIAYGVIETLRQARDNPRLELVHRLDRDTSGCLLVAKTLKATREYQDMFRQRSVEKRYRALLCGHWQVQSERIANTLLSQRTEAGEQRVAHHREGKKAESFFSTRQVLSDATEVDVAITTGRMHQIRVHAADSGHPVVGDQKYGDREQNRVFRRSGLKRCYLHAESVRLADGKHFEQSPGEQWHRDILALTHSGR